MSGKEQTFFFKRLAYLTSANVPLAEGLLVLQGQVTRKRHAHMLDRVLQAVQEGQPLSRACAKFPNVFGGFCIAILKVGESSGTLPAALGHLALELKKKQQLRAKVLGAFIYPAVITLATLGITAFLMLFLFPKITPIFRSLNADLPFSTRVVMGASTFLTHYGLAVIALLAALIICGIYAFRQSQRFRLLLERAALRTPVVGGMLRSYQISNLSRTLGLLLQSGVRIEEALRIAADATPNLVYKRECESLEVAAAHGGRLSSHLLGRGACFPAAFCHMLAVGEKSGALPETFLYLAEMYDAEVDDYTKNLSTLIEPALMVGMGVLVGFIAVSIITPIYGITQSLHT